MRRSGTRVAIVERQEIFRAGLRAILDDLPLVVVVGEAEAAADALEVVRSTRPDVLLLDGALPDVPLVARALLKVSPRLAIIVLAPDSVPEKVVDAIAAGARGYLLKGVPRDELAQAIDRATVGEAFIDPTLAGQVVESLADRAASGSHRRPDPLTPRELEVLAEISRGRSNKEIATDLTMAAGTVKIHVERILRKLSAANRVEAATIGLHYGLIHIEDTGPTAG